jgi:phenylacetate-coenzyme A ligase PaaK-like adenylate-forming protein
MDRTTLRERIFNTIDPIEFNALCIDLFHYQYNSNPVYQQFVDGIKKDISSITHFENIPFLPVGFFRTHRVSCSAVEEAIVFESSGTTGMVPSRHYIPDFNLYEESFTKGFQRFFGPASQYCIFALLPSYLERGNSSLVYMVERLQWKSDLEFGGFFLHETEQLKEEVERAIAKGKKVMILGVTFALLDLAGKGEWRIPGTYIIETGGMKGRSKELTRDELHSILTKQFGVASIYSEYGMTELLSQAWSGGNGIYQCPPWMKILISDPNDPLSLMEEGRVGGINIIDLANLDSCAFIATRDLGRRFPDGSFEVLGRFDDSDIRGCSLLAG